MCYSGYRLRSSGSRAHVSSHAHHHVLPGQRIERCGDDNPPAGHSDVDVHPERMCE